MVRTALTETHGVELGMGEIPKATPATSGKKPRRECLAARAPKQGDKPT